MCCLSGDNAWALLFDWGIAPDWVSRGTLRKLFEAVLPLTGQTAANSGSFTERYPHGRQERRDRPGGSKEVWSNDRKKSKIPVIKTTPQKKGALDSSLNVTKSPTSGTKKASPKYARSKSSGENGDISFDEWLLLLVWLAREKEGTIIDSGKLRSTNTNTVTRSAPAGGTSPLGEEDRQIALMLALFDKMNKSEGKIHLHRKKGLHMQHCFRLCVA